MFFVLKQLAWVSVTWGKELCQVHLGHLPSASAEIEPCVAAAVDLPQHPLRKFRVENGALNAQKLIQVFRRLDIL